MIELYKVLEEEFWRTLHARDSLDFYEKANEFAESVFSVPYDMRHDDKYIPTCGSYYCLDNLHVFFRAWSLTDNKVPCRSNKLFKNIRSFQKGILSFDTLKTSVLPPAKCVDWMFCILRNIQNRYILGIEEIFHYGHKSLDFKKYITQKREND